MTGENNKKQRIEELLLAFVACGSFTNKAENEIIAFFSQWTQENEYFRQHRQHWGFYPLQDDPLQRQVAWCLVKGQGDKTVILLHHHDIVDTLEYGEDAPWALKPQELSLLYAKKYSGFPDEVVADIKENSWLFGRGVADMKAGAAIQMELIEEYSRKSDFSGNLLLLSVPDEENLSAGMNSAIYLLKELQRQYNLDYKMLLNCEPHTRQDFVCPTIYRGSIGKIMPLFYIRGETCHVSQIYDGYSASSIMSELIRRIELNPEFIEHDGSTTSPPPAVLLARDLKPVYDVSIPQSAWFLLNILPLQAAPLEILNKLKLLSQEALAQILQDNNSSYQQYCNIAHIPYVAKTWSENVLLFEELYKTAIANSPEIFKAAYSTLLAQLTKQYHDNQISIHHCSRQLIELCLQYADLTTPVVVIALTPPFYPSVHNNMLDAATYQYTETLIAELCNFSQNQNKQQLAIQDYFSGISDLSYAGFYHSSANIDCLQSNMPAWKTIYSLALELIKELALPVLNIGPWGKDCHTRYERVYKDDLFSKTPSLLQWVVEYLLKNK